MEEKRGLFLLCVRVKWFLCSPRCSLLSSYPSKERGSEYFQLSSMYCECIWVCLGHRDFPPLGRPGLFEKQ